MSSEIDNIKSMSREELEEYALRITRELEEEKQLRENDKAEYETFENEYENMVMDLKKELANSKGKIISLEITLESYKKKIGIPIIVEGDEKDIYPGEQKDFILSLIKSLISNFDNYTRAYKICESILNGNKENGTRSRIKETITSTLKNYTGMSKDVISALNSVGIRVAEYDSSHCKVYFERDDRYIVSISHSPSDFKCGLNAITDINRMFF